MTPPTFFGKAEESFFRIVMVDTITAEGVFLKWGEYRKRLLDVGIL
jgi:hypothetical protein